MTHTIQLKPRRARFRALLLSITALAICACDSAERLTSTTPEDVALEPAAEEDTFTETDTLAATDLSDPTGGLPIHDADDFGLDELEEGGVENLTGPSLAAASVTGGVSSVKAFRGGIPFGTFHLPSAMYGTIYNGSIAPISVFELIGYLNRARQTGTRIVVSFSGSERHFKNSNRSFSMTKWKARVARYRGMNLAPYINDGTLVAHYLFDEPHDPSNWGGQPVSRATIDEMARFSKSLFPTLPTVVRSPPQYLRGYNYRYLDGAWAQYHSRFGSPSAWLSRQVGDAKAAGLSLVTGLNQLAGGARAGGLRGFYKAEYAMSATQLRTWGAALLNDAYPCAFLNWAYNARYMARADIRSAMSYLSGKARAKSARSCRAGGRSGPVGPSPAPSPGGSGGSASVLRVSGRVQNRRNFMSLTWSGIRGSSVDVYRNGVRVKRTENDGRYTNVLRSRGPIRYTYKVCRTGTATCSRSVTVAFR